MSAECETEDRRFLSMFGVAWGLIPDCDIRSEATILKIYYFIWLSLLLFSNHGFLMAFVILFQFFELKLLVIYWFTSVGMIFAPAQFFLSTQVKKRPEIWREKNTFLPISPLFFTLPPFRLSTFLVRHCIEKRNPYLMLKLEHNKKVLCISLKLT